MKEIAKVYDPKEVEDKWYSYWMKQDYFKASVNPDKTPYTIVIPPPNVTGILTMGHILNNTVQDILIRWHRIKGFEACWIPGMDHASIATETKVTKFLKEQGIVKKELGREKFLEKAWEWTEKYGGIIIQQLKKLGASCDWERERFTMDDGYYRAVIHAFVELYHKGLIYRGKRMINWDPASKSAISDEEVIYKQINGKLWHFRYPIEGQDEYVVVATTRPETMLGDTAVAVHPEDKRYKHLIGKTVLLPIVGRKLQVIADNFVDPEFGTGVVKVTPAHDPNDNEMGKRHNLKIVNILNPDASLNENVPEEFIGLDRFDARKAVVEEMESLGYLDKIEDYIHNVGYSERGNVPIESYISDQWFMKMEELGKPALEAVRSDKIRFHPNGWVKDYEHWMTNIQDWCISRQLWWGHRIPIYYCNDCRHVMCDIDTKMRCDECDSKNIRQDEDVLDTWASSWLWPFAVHKWPENDPDLEYFYPTNSLVTGPDIIFFWVARMIISGYEFIGKIPFTDVYFTGMVRDTQGRKMSKSLGNSPDPLDLIDEYGADALRFTMAYLTPLGHDIYFSDEKCELGRNFANKIWNAARFNQMMLDDIELNEPASPEDFDNFIDRWMFSRLHRTIDLLHNDIADFHFTEAAKRLYDVIWNDYCDWYLEMLKPRLTDISPEEKATILNCSISIFETLMHLLHPFMPFITEELWQSLRRHETGESIMVSPLPDPRPELIKDEVETRMQLLQQVITAVRNIRGEMNVPLTKKVDILFRVKNNDVRDFIKAQCLFIQTLAKVDNISIGKSIEKPKLSASKVVQDFELFVPLEGLIDIEHEKKRLQKEIDRLDKQLQGLDAKLNNENFLNRAPQTVIEKEKNKKNDFEEKHKKLQANLQIIET